jgi:hypothetical protein
MIRTGIGCGSGKAQQSPKGLLKFDVFNNGGIAIGYFLLYKRRIEEDFR